MERCIFNLAIRPLRRVLFAVSKPQRSKCSSTSSILAHRMFTCCLQQPSESVSIQACLHVAFVLIVHLPTQTQTNRVVFVKLSKLSRSCHFNETCQIQWGGGFKISQIHSLTSLEHANSSMKQWPIWFSFTRASVSVRSSLSNDLDKKLMH